ncbi:MAG TPA: metallophosphoesterase [Candidatus Paceibacterota bacterium]|nr:metallophosphoesterase [Candidatus Paceibacterota bacterium]
MMSLLFRKLWLAGQARLTGALLGLGCLSGFAAEPFFFIQLTDPQLGMFATNANFAQETANLEFAVATVNRLRPAFVVVTGDLVNQPGDAAQIAEYKRIMGRVDAGIPVYHVAGNHDLGSVPTPQSVAAYTNAFGRDSYTFQHGDFAGVVLNSGLIHSPQKAPDLCAAQERWLRTELERLTNRNARPLVLFQHHSWFLKSADEPDEYFNLPLESRNKYLPLLRSAGVKFVFCGHYHRNAVATDGGLEVVTTGPVGKPLGKDSKSGLRVVIVRGEEIEHQFYDFGDLPDRIELYARRPKSAPPR